MDGLETTRAHDSCWPSYGATTQSRVIECASPIPMSVNACNGWAARGRHAAALSQPFHVERTRVR